MIAKIGQIALQNEAGRHGVDRVLSFFAVIIAFIQDLVPKKLGAVMRIAVHAICCFLFAVLLVFSVKYCGKLVKTATALPIKMKYIYLCIPISMGVLMLHALVMALGEVETMKEVKG